MNAFRGRWAIRVLPVSALLVLSVATWSSAADEKPKDPIVVAGRAVELAVRPVGESIVRITLSPLGDDGTPAPLWNEPVLTSRQWSEPVIRLRSSKGKAEAMAGKLHVSATARPPVIRVKRKDGRVVQNIRVDQSNGEVRFLLGEGPVFGLGQGGQQFDRIGTVYPMINHMHAWDLKHLGGRVPIPWLVSTSGCRAVFVHQPHGRFFLWWKSGIQFTPYCKEQALPLDLFVVAADRPAGLMKAYAELTGYPAMPPIWALGYAQSHRTLAGPEEVLGVAQKLRDKKLPCDILCYLMAGYAKSGWSIRNGSFEWNKKIFPDPEAIIGKLHEMNFKICLHVGGPPKSLRGSPRDKSGLNNPNHAAGYWAKHLGPARLCDAWWIDHGEWLDVTSRLTRHQMYYEGPLMERPNCRPHALHRTGYAGMQRWGGWLWTGDPHSTWKTLENHVPIGINTSLSGIPFWGSDIGGFFPTKETTGELFVRWFQFGCFSPVCRSHGVTWHLHLPWGWNTGTLGHQETDHSSCGTDEEPDVAETRNPHVEPICRKYLELRYRMLPYIYTLVREAHDTGMPMIRALWLHYPDDPKAVARGDEYLWGRDILVAPVTEKGATVRRVYLPRGDWYDFWTEEKLAGGRTVQRQVDLATMPLYIRAGAILPTGPVKQYTTEKTDEPLTVTVYPGTDGRFTLYEDDGLTFAYREGQFMRTRFVWDDDQRRLTIALVEGSKLLPPGKREIVVRLASDDATRSVVFRGEPVQVKFQ